MLLVSLAAGCLLATSALQRSPPARRRCSRSRLPTLQVNSDSRATQEYFDFLLGKTEIEPTEDQPSVIVGGGKIGEMLREFGERRGFEDVVLGRGEAIPSGHPGPVYLAVPAAELDAAIELCPEEKRDDLVFLSDGQLEPLFQRHGLYGPCQARAALRSVPPQRRQRLLTGVRSCRSPWPHTGLPLARADAARRQAGRRARDGPVRHDRRPLAGPRKVVGRASLDAERVFQQHCCVFAAPNTDTARCRIPAPTPARSRRRPLCP